MTQALAEELKLRFSESEMKKIGTKNYNTFAIIRLSTSMLISQANGNIAHFDQNDDWILVRGTHPTVGRRRKRYLGFWIRVGCVPHTKYTTMFRFRHFQNML